MSTSFQLAATINLELQSRGSDVCRATNFLLAIAVSTFGTAANARSSEYLHGDWRGGDEDIFYIAFKKAYNDDEREGSHEAGYEVVIKHKAGTLTNVPAKHLDVNCTSPEVDDYTTSEIWTPSSANVASTWKAGGPFPIFRNFDDAQFISGVWHQICRPEKAKRVGRN